MPGQPYKVIHDWIERVNDDHQTGQLHLSDWEENFMESITEQFESRGSLNP